LGALISSVKRAAADASPEITLDFRAFNADIQESLQPDRLMAMLTAFFGFLAALLATVGLYGVISYMVAKRTSEIGIRIALGADRGRVLKLVMREATILLAVGVVIGIGLALSSAQAASSLVFGLKPRDPLTFTLATVVLGTVAIAATYFPARRAARLEPMHALREE
jgi:ABC-type antimicrobial peptide transport system permease subunit